MNRHPHPSLASRANTIMELAIGTGAGWLAQGWIVPDPVGAGATLNALAVIALSTTLTVKVWDRYCAPRFVNLNHQPERLYIVPWEDGYVVAQPRHHWTVKGSHHWGWRDTETSALYGLAGYVVTAQMAQELCRNMSGEWGTLLAPPADLSAAHQALVDQVHLAARQEYGRQPPQQVVELQHWDIAQIPQTSSPAYSALRRVMTPTGPVWEFFPPPPLADSDIGHLKQRLKAIAGAGPDLDDRVVDQALIAHLTPEQHQAWQRQQGTWVMVPLDAAHPAHAERWVAAQLTENGRVMAWEPAVPHTWPSREAGHQALQPSLGPLAAAPACASSDQTPGLRMRWRHQVVQREGLAVGPAHTVPDDRPWTRALALTDSLDPQWRVMAQDTPHGSRWLAVECTRLSAHQVAVRPLMRPENPHKIWLSAQPDAFEAILGAQGLAAPVTAARITVTLTRPPATVPQVESVSHRTKPLGF